MKWFAIQSFVENPFHIVEPMEEDADILIDNDIILSYNPQEARHESWMVPEMEPLRRALRDAYEKEKNAVRVPGFWAFVSKLNAGGLIGARSFNIFQKHENGIKYLEYMELFIRAEIFSQRESGLKILNVNEDLTSLSQALVNFNTANEVVDISKYLLDQESLDAKKRKVCTRSIIWRLKQMLDKFTENGVDLIVANCIHFPRAESYNMMGDVQSYRECQQVYSFIVLALELLSSGGSLVLRVHGYNDGYFVSNMYILYLLFERVSFFKSLVSNDSNMEMLIVATGFQPQNLVAFQEKIKESLDFMVTSQHSDDVVGVFPFARNEIPDAFINSVVNALYGIIHFVADCKIRNADYARSNFQMRSRQNKYTKHYQTKTVTKWMLFNRLEKIYFPVTVTGPEPALRIEEARENQTLSQDTAIVPAAAARTGSIDTVTEADSIHETSLVIPSGGVATAKDDAIKPGPRIAVLPDFSAMTDNSRQGPSSLFYYPKLYGSM